jgi:hypothetical protein
MKKKQKIISIFIDNSLVASDAAAWCEENFPAKSWDINFRWPAKGYDFTFNDDKRATLFSLKWVGAI